MMLVREEYAYYVAGVIRIWIHELLLESRAESEDEASYKKASFSITL